MPDGTAYDPYPGQTSTTGGNGTYQGGNTGYNWSGYAEWLAKTKNSTKTCNLIVNYYANGYNGSAAENPPPSSVRSYTGQSVDVRLVVEVASGDTMSNPGYVFVGWATSNDTPTITYNPGDTISNSWASDYRGNSITNLYAVWTNQNVITYNPDDNSIEKSAIYQVKQSGQSATLKGATFTRTGYTQTGWATTAGGPKVYDLGGTYSSNNPLSLYPVWQANTYTITYVANEGTGTMADQTVTYDSTFTPSACSFTREGYSFSSWNESQDGKGIRWKVQEYTVDRAENITLYAIWKGNEYTVYYDDNYSRYSDEITGDIVTFESEYAQPLKKAEVSFSPIQDLHGYAKPWPGGGGKNLYFPTGRTIEYSGGTISVNDDGRVSYTGTPTGAGGRNTLALDSFTLQEGTYTVSFSGTKTAPLYLINEGNNTNLIMAVNGGTFTLSETTSLHFGINIQSAQIGTTFNDSYYIQVEEGSTATSFAPYSNICPITGRTGLSVYRTGKNLFNPHLYAGIDYNPTVGAAVTLTDAAQQFTDDGSGVFTLTTSSTWRQYSIVIPVVEVNNYHMKFSCSSSGQMGTTRGFLDANHKVLQKFNSTDTSQSYNYNMVFPTGAAYFYMVITNRSTASATLTLTQPQFELGSTATTYEPYNGNTYAVDWSTQVGTVYGGTVDVVTGVLTANRITYAFDGTESFTNYTTGIVCNKDMPVGYSVAGSDILCSHSTTAYIRFSNSSKSRVEFKKAYFGVTSADELKTLLANWNTAGTPLQYSYELATPITYQLSPTQVAVLTGTNNVWSDGGPITIVYALDEVPQNMPPSTAIFGDIFYTRRNQLSRFGLTFKGWNTVPDGSGEAWLPSGVSMGTYKRTEDAVWNVSHNVTLYAQWDPNVYPFGTVFFNGRNAQDLGIIVEELPSYYYAERAFNHKQVNGKNGDVILDTGRYENVKKVYKVACYDPSRNFYESAVALSTFLHSAGSEYIRLEDSYEPTSYRMAIYEETNEIENLLGKAGRCEITFNCMPQRFLLSGDEEITIPSSGYSIYNPTAFDAKPMIRIQGTGTVTINGRFVQVTDNDNDMLVDCENQNAKDLSGADMNYFIYCDEFPILKPGFNTISYTETIDAVKITPRWWIL